MQQSAQADDDADGAAAAAGAEPPSIANPPLDDVQAGQNPEWDEEGQAANAGGQITPQSQQQATWRDRLVERGFQLPEDEDGALESLVEFAQQAQAAAQQAQYWQQVAPHWTAFQQWQAQQAQPQQPQQPQQPAQPTTQDKEYWPKPPEWNPRWVDMIERDEAGNVVGLKPGASPDLLQKIQAYSDYRNERINALAENPHEALWGGFEERVQKLIEERMQRTIAEYDANQSARQFVNQNANWLVGQDPLGNVVLRPEGQQFQHALQYLIDSGVANPDARRALAMQLIRGQYAEAHLRQIQQGAPQQPANGQQRRQADQQFLRAAARKPNRAGSVPRAAMPSVPQNDKIDFATLFRSRLREQGYLPALDE